MNIPITAALQTVIRNLRNSNKSYYSPNEFKYIISKHNSKILQNEPNDSRLLTYSINYLVLLFSNSP